MFRPIFQTDAIWAHTTCLFLCCVHFLSPLVSAHALVQNKVNWGPRHWSLSTFSKKLWSFIITALYSFLPIKSLLIQFSWNCTVSPYHNTWKNATLVQIFAWFSPNSNHSPEYPGTFCAIAWQHLPDRRCQGAMHEWFSEWFMVTVTVTEWSTGSGTSMDWCLISFYKNLWKWKLHVSCVDLVINVLSTSQRKVNSRGK